MKFKFSKNLEYQLEAINSVVDIFDTGINLERGIENSFDLKPLDKIQIIANNLEIKKDLVIENLKNIQEKNNICERDQATKEITKYIIDEENFTDFSVEMETGTGKTYVYLRTIFELNKKYNLRKFIILVPSVAIREGVLKSIEQMKDHFKSLYKVNFKGFAYDSNKLNEVRDFIESDNLIIMIMTVQSFRADTTVMRQNPDRFQGNSPIDLVASTNPVIIMDEPQNMESDLAKEAIQDLNPLIKLRYSATHKELYNLVYRLTPVDAYRNKLVKQIEVYGIKEDNPNEFLFKVKNIITERGKDPRAKAVLSFKEVDNAYVEKEITLNREDDLFRKTNNEIYKDLIIFNINARENRVELSDGRFFEVEREIENKEETFRIQIRETIKLHLDKQKRLKDLNIKVLSLFFIDKVDNYIHNDSLIRNIFNEEFDRLKINYENYKNTNSEAVHKGYFASKKVRGVNYYKDSVSGISKEDKEAYNLIMKDKERLLSFDESVSFIFSHSALKEGWDNPNIFQICTLRETNSVMKKRQEVGRGLRLPVNQDGERIYNNEINILTVIPNESYKDFCNTYQAEMNEAGYKSVEQPGNAKEKIIIKTNKYFESQEFKDLWNRISKKTKYSLEIKTDKLIENSIEEINKLQISNPMIKIETGVIYFSKDKELRSVNTSSSVGKIINQKVRIDNFIERISKETNITKKTILEIFSRVENTDILFKNYEDYIRNIILIIQNEKRKILIEEGLKYIPINDHFEAKVLYKDMEVFKDKFIETTNRSITTGVICDSKGEKEFAESLDNNTKVKIFTKLPRGFVVDTPLGNYIPDWAILYSKDDDDRLYLVRETKFYGGQELEGVLTQDELNKIKCAEKHFEAIDVDYKVIQKIDFSDFV